LRKLVLTLALVLLGQVSFAEFNTTEKTSVEKLRISGEKARQALDDLLGAVAVGTTTNTRAALADAQLKVFLVVRPLNLAHIYLLHGSIGDSGFTLSQQACKDIPVDGSSNVAQSVYVGCAQEAIDLAYDAYDDAQTALSIAQTYNQGSEYQSKLASAVSLLGVSKTRLDQFNRTLTYADPSPAADGSNGAPIQSGLAGGFGTNCGRITGPHGCYTDTLAEGGRATGEYANNAIFEMIEAYSMDDILPEYVTYARVIQKVLRTQDRVQRSIGRFARIQGGETGEANDADWRVRLLRATRDLTDVPGDDFHNALGYPDEFPLVAYVGTRPNFRAKIQQAFRDVTGAWRRTDGAAWRFQFIPGTGLPH
jgi:hypothetical protein